MGERDAQARRQRSADDDARDLVAEHRAGGRAARPQLLDVAPAQSARAHAHEDAARGRGGGGELAQCGRPSGRDRHGEHERTESSRATGGAQPARGLAQGELGDLRAGGLGQRARLDAEDRVRSAGGGPHVVVLRAGRRRRTPAAARASRAGRRRRSRSPCARARAPRRRGVMRPPASAAEPLLVQAVVARHERQHRAVVAQEDERLDDLPDARRRPPPRPRPRCAPSRASRRWRSRGPRRAARCARARGSSVPRACSRRAFCGRSARRGVRRRAAARRRPRPRARPRARPRSAGSNCVPAQRRSSCSAVLDAARGRVRAHLRHRRERVGHGDDARLDRDREAASARRDSPSPSKCSWWWRIARPGGVQCGDALDDLLTELGVAAHDRPLLLVQRRSA